MSQAARDLTITLCQAPLVWHDAAANRAGFEALMATAGDTDIIVLPEMFASGFSMQPERCAETMDGPTVAWMQARAREHDAAVCGSLVIEADGHYVNRFVWAAPGGDLAVYDKRHCFALAKEHEHYAAGTERVIIDYHGWRIAPFVCYDLRFPVWCRYPQGCDLMIFVANWPTPRRYAWSTLLRARAIENQCYVAGVNRVGRDANDKDYPGESAVLDALGAPLVACGDQPIVVTTTLSRAALSELREQLPFYRDADEFELRD